MANRNNPIHAPTIEPGFVGIHPWKRMVSPGVMWRYIPDAVEELESIMGSATSICDVACCTESNTKTSIENI
jgi:hypothetical protein